MAYQPDDNTLERRFMCLTHCSKSMNDEKEVRSQSSLDSFSTEMAESIEDILATSTDLPLRRLDMPSSRPAGEAPPPPAKVRYHDLGSKYPAAPISSGENGLVLHRGVLQDLTGVAGLLDWLSDGEVVIVEVGRLMQRKLEFSTALAQLHSFIEDDLGGQIVQLTSSRLLLLPPGCRGVRGVEDEAFAAGRLE
jgi:SepF-like predicted cell division protein (DUF552 family)